MLFGSTLFHLMYQIGPKTGNPLEIYFGLSTFLLILCVHNVSKNSYHCKGSDKLYTKHEGELTGVVWEHVVSDHGAATA